MCVREPHTLARMYEIRTIGHHEATQAIEMISAEVSSRGSAAVIAVADAYGEIIAVLRMDGASLSSFTIAQHKAFTAAREAQPSSAVGARIRHPQHGYDIAFHGDARYIGWGGGIPVILDGSCVGAISVSGLPEAEDVELAELAVRALLASVVATRTD